MTELTGTSGVITSMRYPKYVYYANNLHKWRITVDPNNVIVLSPLDYMLKRESKVQIYDGYDSASEPLATLDSDNHPPAKVTSSSNIVYIELEILTFSETRFKLKWDQVAKSSSIDPNKPQNTLNCTQNSMITVGRSDAIALTSPGWPNGYDVGLDCSWTFVPAADAVGYHVAYRFRTVDLEASPDCLSDYVQVGVSNNLETFNQSEKMCSLSFGLNKRVHGLPNLQVKFHTDYMTNRSGFESIVSLDCGGFIEGTSGDITSDMLIRPGNMTMLLNRTCTWVIKVKPGRTIKLDFKRLTLVRFSISEHTKPVIRISCAQFFDF